MIGPTDQTHAVAKPCDAYLRMAKDWQVVDDLRGGTRLMRDRGMRYLPKFEMESADDYAARLLLATLYPAFTETAKYMTGRVFSNALIQKDIAPQIAPLLADMDQQGRSLQDLARDWFDLALSYGHAAILVDMPQKAAQVVTAADDKRRPTATLVHARQIIGWKAHSEAGAEVLDQVRIWEVVQREAADGYTMYYMEQIRVLTPGAYELWQLQDISPAPTLPTAPKQAWTMVESGAMDTKTIPLVVLYSERTGTLSSKPPMMELGWLNIKHWQSQSDQDRILHIARVPLLAMIGIDTEGGEVKIAAKSALKVPLGGKIEYVEHSGKAIAAGQASLDSLVEDMRQSGAKLLRPVITSLASKQASTEAIKETSALGILVQATQDGLHKVLTLCMNWLGSSDPAGNVAIDADLEPDYSPNDSFTQLVLMNQNGKLSNETTFNEAVRRGILADDIVWTDEKARVVAEGGIVSPPGVNPLIPEPAPPGGPKKPDPAPAK